ncbi:MAG: [FeFe] hydrogenase H-cluster maturation GTPase HydF [Lachnospiraceae bacterium]|nr:[FeFe] hydrogenase H-cluster maturation GTPase HydF [Lachnospiraceae bacterium]
MSMNNTPASERVHIGIFGCRNAGKSSVINAMTGQNLAIVSDVKGTTTDPVLKAMELLPLGPVVMIDTPGLDDEGALGALRVQKAYQILNKTDIAVLVMDAFLGMTAADRAILEKIKAKEIPFLLVFNKCDLLASPDGSVGSVTADIDSGESAEMLAKAEQLRREVVSKCDVPSDSVFFVSAAKHENIYELKEKIASLAPSDDNSRRIVADLINPGDFVVLVVPIDKAAPKGRLILPQQQTIRDILDSGATAIVTRDSELEDTLNKLGTKPSLVITDSQAFAKVDKLTPSDIPLTSFSILFARYKGNLNTVVGGASALASLEDGDRVLICEGCTHHRQCEDIGTVKLPKWILEYTGKQIDFAFTSGTEFPVDLTPYKLIVHCGGCTLNEREMKFRLKCAEDAGVPITNYGTAIACMKGILGRSIAIFEK